MTVEIGRPTVEILQLMQYLVIVCSAQLAVQGSVWEGQRYLWFDGLEMFG